MDTGACAGGGASVDRRVGMSPVVGAGIRIWVRMCARMRVRVQKRTECAGACMRTDAYVSVRGWMRVRALAIRMYVRGSVKEWRGVRV